MIYIWSWSCFHLIYVCFVGLSCKNVKEIHKTDICQMKIKPTSYVNFLYIFLLNMMLVLFTFDTCLFCWSLFHFLVGFKVSFHVYRFLFMCVGLFSWSLLTFVTALRAAIVYFEVQQVCVWHLYVYRGRERERETESERYRSFLRMT